jgi:uncharacterized zinc-type alcohol dehydrogenase-like protein
MSAVAAYAAQSPTSEIAPFSIDRRAVGPHDVEIDILYCGICHSDIHMARNEWGGTMYPIVPGHEIVGRVTAVGSDVVKFKAGDLAGVGCIVESCRTCPACNAHEEQYCEHGMVGTYNGKLSDGSITYGGYSKKIVVDAHYCLEIPENLPLEGVAPLLCAGITTYSPLSRWEIGPGHKIAVVGLGGLGHMAVKFAVAFGAEVTVISTSPSKEADARKLGAHHFLVSTNAEAMKASKSRFDFILSTISAPHDYNAYLQLLQLNGTMVVVGIPPTPVPVAAYALIGRRRSLAGSLIGGIKETQEMLDFCAEHNIVSEVEVVEASKINEAYERMLKNDVRYRFVIDAATI